MSPADVNRDPCCKLRDMATFSVEDPDIKIEHLPIEISGHMIISGMLESHSRSASFHESIVTPIRCVVAFVVVVVMVVVAPLLIHRCACLFDSLVDGVFV